MCLFSSTVTFLNCCCFSSTEFGQEAGATQALAATMAGSSEGPIRALTGAKGAAGSAAGGQAGDAHGTSDGTGTDAELAGEEADVVAGTAGASNRVNRQALSRRNQQELEELARLVFFLLSTNAILRGFVIRFNLTFF